MLIYGTIFNMMSVFNDYIVRDHNKNPIDAEDWAMMRNYYNMMLRFIDEILCLIWVPEDLISFNELVNDSIKNDKQQMLGSISSFKSFIVKRNYENQYKLSLNVSRGIIFQLDNYIDKAKILTTVGTIVKPFVSSNGITDTHIVKRKAILERVNGLLGDFEKWER